MSKHVQTCPKNQRWFLWGKASFERLKKKTSTYVYLFWKSMLRCRSNCGEAVQLASNSRCFHSHLCWPMYDLRPIFLKSHHTPRLQRGRQEIEAAAKCYDLRRKFQERWPGRIGTGDTRMPKQNSYVWKWCLKRLFDLMLFEHTEDDRPAFPYLPFWGYPIFNQTHVSPCSLRND